MKTLIFLAIGILFVGTTSCGKYYSCECTTTTVIVSVGAGTTTATSSFKGTSSTYGRRMKKDEATTACNHEREAIESNINKGATDNGNVPLNAGSSITTACEVK